MYNRQDIDIDIEKYIATSSQFNHPGNHRKVHTALNMVIGHLSKIRQGIIQEKLTAKIQYDLFKYKNVLRLDQYLEELDIYLTAIGRKINGLHKPKTNHHRSHHERDIFQGKQASISDALRRLRNKIRNIPVRLITTFFPIEEVNSLMIQFI